MQDAPSIRDNSARPQVEAQNTTHTANNTHAHDYKGAREHRDAGFGDSLPRRVGCERRGGGSIPDRITVRQSVSSSTETHGPVVAVAVSASPHIGEDAAERVGGVVAG